MACNLPVVSTDVGDVDERLSGVSPSAVCRSDQELIDGLAEILRKREPSNGREYAVELSSERMAKQIHEVYRSVADDYTPTDERKSKRQTV